MEAKIQPSNGGYRNMIELYKNNKIIDRIYVGDMETEYYIDHKDTKRMRFDLYLKGAIYSDKNIWYMENLNELHTSLKNVDKSVKYHWNNIYDANCWERWLLNSEQRIVDSKKLISQKFGIKFIK